MEAVSTASSWFLRIAIPKTWQTGFREDGLKVIGIGEKKVPEPLRNVCNRFIFIENLLAEKTKVEAGKQIAKKENLREAVKLLCEAMDHIQQNHAWVPLSALGSAATAAHTDFDARTYGKSKPSELVAAISIFETRKIGNHIMVRHAKKRPKT